VSPLPPLQRTYEYLNTICRLLGLGCEFKVHLFKKSSPYNRDIGRWNTVVLAQFAYFGTIPAPLSLPAVHGSVWLVCLYWTPLLDSSTWSFFLAWHTNQASVVSLSALVSEWLQERNGHTYLAWNDGRAPCV